MARTRTPDWLVERLAAGDLPPAEAEAIRARLAAEEGGPERLAAIEASNRAILAAHPPARVAAAIRERSQPRRETGRWRVSAAVAVPALAVALVVAVMPGTESDRGAADGSAEGIRLKGAQPRLLVHRSGATGPERLASGASAKAGDLLQLSYQAAGAGYGVILSIDGRGAVTLHFPDGATAAAPLLPDGAVALPQAYELDDAPAFERFFFVTSEAPFPVETAVTAARRLAGGRDAAAAELPLPASLQQSSFLLEKVP